MNEPLPLILASTSRWRAELLARLDLPFGQCAPPYDERAEDHHFEADGPEAFALRLARGKAVASAAVVEGEAWVLAADQLAVLRERGRDVVLHKPGTVEAAADQLMRLAGREHRLITAVVLHHLRGPQSQAQRHAIDEQRLTMRAFGHAEAQAYAERYRPVDSCGAYHIEDAGIRLFERIEGGDFTSIMGLPLLAVCRLLRGAGLLPGDVGEPQ
ncbi:maf protein [Plesiocystis pacifica SIR-1]|uniref:7-methyl-GTP pyrophosphatase n=1 Tax=Plesiocystis pacifica SIR-1 TaxID=391625 RepID=A6FYZ0_9BACT|nr:Maf family protein [Plesiocystis pacifica]EDM81145.1 maf protein [Plesiocystis pacifica SIR-1]